MSHPLSSRQILKDCVVSIAGSLDDNIWREEQVRKWVQYWGGKFVSLGNSNNNSDNNNGDGGNGDKSNDNKDTTHLLCTEANFRKGIAVVREARRNKGYTKIVLRDWLEESINKKMCLKTLPYELDELVKEEKAKEKAAQKAKKYTKVAENYVDERFWHVYRDITFFEYQVRLQRGDERHTLTLWESNAKPYNYRCTTLYRKKPGVKAARHAFNETPVNLVDAIRTFGTFFRKRVGVAWDDRIDNDKMGAVAGEDRFRYELPGGGRPIGLVRGCEVSIFDWEGDSGSSNHQEVNADASCEPETKTGKEEQDGKTEGTGDDDKDQHITDSVSVKRKQDNDDGDNDHEHPGKRARYETPTTSSLTAIHPTPNHEVVNQRYDETSTMLDSELLQDGDEDAHGSSPVPSSSGHKALCGDSMSETAAAAAVDDTSEGALNGQEESYILDDQYDDYNANTQEMANNNNINIQQPATPGNNSTPAEDDDDDHHHHHPEAAGKNNDVMQLYDSIQQASTKDDWNYSSPAEDAGTDTATQSQSLEEARATRSARRRAGNIIYETQRGTFVARDNQAALIHMAVARRDLIQAREEKRREEEAEEEE